MKKNRKKAGFTLAETLITMLILLMVTGIVAAGMPVAVNAYNRVIDAANAQSLLATTVTRLREELGTALQVEYTVDGTERVLYSYTNGEKGYYSQLVNARAPVGAVPNEAPLGIQIVYTSSVYNGATVPEPTLLVPELKMTDSRNRNGKLYAEYADQILYENGVFVVKGLKVLAVDKNGNAKDTDTKIDRLVIRPICEPESKQYTPPASP